MFFPGTHIYIFGMVGCLLKKHKTIKKFKSEMEVTLEYLWQYE